MYQIIIHTPYGIEKTSPEELSSEQLQEYNNLLTQIVKPSTDYLTLECEGGEIFLNKEMIQKCVFKLVKV